MADLPLWRIIFECDMSRVLQGVLHHEGRFHHSGQPAFYASPDPKFVDHTIQAFVRPYDPPRIMVPLMLRNAHLLDLRDPAICKRMNITPQTPSVPWQPERQVGQKATSWQASDAVRDSGADGLIYAARSAPERWHVVLFKWNHPKRTQLEISGKPIPWISSNSAK